MKVVCTQNIDHNGKMIDLTIGKLYITYHDTSRYNYKYFYYIVNDQGFINLYNKNVFITLQESRGLKLKKLEL
jgi:hypothetical protein